MNIFDWLQLKTQFEAVLEWIKNMEDIEATMFFQAINHYGLVGAGKNNGHLLVTDLRIFNEDDLATLDHPMFDKTTIMHVKQQAEGHQDKAALSVQNITTEGIKELLTDISLGDFPTQKITEDDLVIVLQRKVNDKDEMFYQWFKIPRDLTPLLNVDLRHAPI